MKLRSNQNIEILKKGEQFTFEHRPCRQILMVWLMKTKVKKWNSTFPEKQTYIQIAGVTTFYSHGW